MIIITKIVSQMIYPLNLALLLFVLAGVLFQRKHTRCGMALLVFAVTWLWFWSAPITADRVRAAMELRYPPVQIDAMAAADAIVVLGGGMAPHTPPRLHPDINAAADRVWHAARLYHAGKAPKIILSGGYSLIPGENAQPESDSMAVFLRDLGVPDSAVIHESESRNTHENAVLTKRILEREKIERFLLVTSAQHMPRSLMIFRAHGMQPIPAPTDYEIELLPPKPFLLRLLPDSRSLEGATRAFKECIGIIGYGLQQQISP